MYSENKMTQVIIKPPLNDRYEILGGAIGIGAQAAILLVADKNEDNKKFYI